MAMKGRDGITPTTGFVNYPPTAALGGKGSKESSISPNPVTAAFFAQQRLIDEFEGEDFLPSFNSPADRRAKEEGEVKNSATVLAAQKVVAEVRHQTLSPVCTPTNGNRARSRVNTSPLRSSDKSNLRGTPSSPLSAAKGRVAGGSTSVPTTSEVRGRSRDRRTSRPHFRSKSPTNRGGDSSVNGGSRSPSRRRPSRSKADTTARSSVSRSLLSLHQ